MTLGCRDRVGSASQECESRSNLIEAKSCWCTNDNSNEYLRAEQCLNPRGRVLVRRTTCISWRGVDVAIFSELVPGQLHAFVRRCRFGYLRDPLVDALLQEHSLLFIPFPEVVTASPKKLSAHGAFLVQPV